MDLFNKCTKNIDCNAYHNILDFENTNERKCGDLDRLNEKIYKKLLAKAQNAEKTIQNTGLSMNLEVPTPPHPSNRDKYIIWKKRNCKQSVIDQTEAVLFLKDNGYVYNEDYEAYQAISLANEIKKGNGIDINYRDNTKNFENVYNENDKNLMRRKSMYNHNSNQSREHLQSNSNINQDINNYSFQNQNIRQSTYNHLQQADLSYLTPHIRKQISPIAIPMPNAPQLAFCNRNLNHQPNI